jgi:hypothetical protein
MSNNTGPVAAENITVEPRRLHMEVMNPLTGDIWLLQAPVTTAEFKALQPEPPFVKIGLGAAAMDTAHFSRSPGAGAHGAVETRLIGGRTFSRIARVKALRLPQGAVPELIQVEKHHCLGFAAGRKVVVARLPDGQFYVEQTEAMAGKAFEPPAGWQMYVLPLAAAWSFELPSPTRIHFFSSLRSFIGPVAPEHLPATPEPLERP